MEVQKTTKKRGSSKSRTFLFDIDGTLGNSSYSSPMYDPFYRLQANHGLNQNRRLEKMPGATDVERIKKLFPCGDLKELQILVNEFDFYAIDGASELTFTSMLPELPKLFNIISKEVCIGVLTGNTMARARVKLEKLEILDLIVGRTLGSETYLLNSSLSNLIQGPSEKVVPVYNADFILNLLYRV